MADAKYLAAMGITLSPNVILKGRVTFERPVLLHPAVTVFNSDLGAYSYVAPYTSVHLASVGRYTSIGNDGVIGPSMHPTGWLTTSSVPYEDTFRQSVPPDLLAEFTSLKPVRIGNDVWIGARSSVMGGVTVGDGAIIGLGSVVTKDVPSYAIMGGTPARLIRYRFPEEMIRRMLAFKWWRFDLVAARKAGLTLAWDDPARALGQLEEAEARGTLPLISDQVIALQSA